MQSLKKLLRLLTLLCIILPLSGMFKFNPKTLQRLKRVQQAQKRTIETSQPNININQPTIPKNTGFFSWLSSWWSSSTALQKKVTPPYQTLYNANPLIEKFKNTLKGQNNNNINTPSYRHIEEYASDLLEIYPNIINNANIKNMLQSAIHKEKELNDLGYETFFHGGRWEYNLLYDIYNMLVEYKSGKKLNNFIFTRLEDPIPIINKNYKRFFEREKSRHELLLKEGNEQNNDMVNYDSLLFLNKFLFGNIKDVENSPINHVLKNEDFNRPRLSIQDIFEMFKEEPIYTMYEQKLKNLQQQHKKLSSFGELLLIAIPKDKINKSVYYTTYGESQKNNQKKSFYIPGQGETTDTAKMVNYLNKNPQKAGQSEFFLVNTWAEDGGLNDKSGIKVFSFNAADPHDMYLFNKNKKALSSEIEQSMKEEDSKKAMKAASRE